MLASELEVISRAETPPFPIEDRSEADELLRLEYRYLDLRRPEMTAALRMRHRINAIIHQHMDALGFLEVETPLLTRSTPEGARDFLVPSRLQPGSFYALPQSPQQLKQLLMVAGQDRYYQIVRCLRDENPRADRGLEFTQLDVEMSFVDEEDIVAVIEPLYARLVSELQGVEVPTPFPRMTYDEMFQRYGSDKPDLRYGMELAGSHGPVPGQWLQRVREGGRRRVARSRRSRRPVAGNSRARNSTSWSRTPRAVAPPVLVWMVVEEGGSVRSPVEKFLGPAEIDGIVTRTGASAGDLICIVADVAHRVNVALDGLRRDLAVRLDLIPEGAWSFCWYFEAPHVRVERRRGTVDGEPPPVHGATHR